MITATAATAEAKARFDRVQEVLKSPAPGEAVGTVTDTLHNDVITKLRQRYLEDREHVARWTGKMGPQHLAVINLQQEMKVEERFRLECIGLLPLIATTEPPKKQRGEGPSNQAPDLSKKFLGDVPKLLAAGGPLSLASNKPRARLDLTHKVANDPFSHFSERVRSVKIALDSMSQIRPLQCIGVISAVPGEGKSTVAVNLANVLARGGRSTLLIDADLRNPQLTRRLSRDAKCGLLELMAGSVHLTEATRMVSDSRLCFLPAVMRQPIANSSDLLASERMHAVLTAARHGFDHVIIDLPPLGPISDSRAIASLVDSFIMVVNWGRTRCEVVEEALANFGTPGRSL
jgi:capsular exopolysaccharide synthesis family protein